MDAVDSDVHRPLLEEEEKVRSNDEDQSPSSHHHHHVVVEQDRAIGGGSEASFSINATDSCRSKEEKENDVSTGISSATIAFWKIRYEVPHRLKKGTKRVLLDDISGIVHPGQVLAIMGPSGCGKTSILEILGARNSPTQGGIAANGHLYDALTRRYIGLVPQDEALFPTLTVRESMLFSAALRLPSHMTWGEKEKKVHQVMEELNLTSVKDSLIGDKLKRGISGGERKRVSIGKELCYEPKLLLLDEPTSGLDSFTSIKVMKLLRRLAERGRTLACTIHQPSSEIFSRFDQLMLLVSGRAVYHGAASTASLSYFQNLGFHCPQYANPADFFLSLCDESDEPSAEDPTGPTPRETVDRLVGTYAASEVKKEALVRIEVVKRAALITSITRRGAEQQTYLPTPSFPSSSEQQQQQVDGKEEEVKQKRRRRRKKDLQGEDGGSNTTTTPPTIASVSWARQFSVLCRRSLLHSCRNPLSSYVIMGRTVVMTLLVGSLYWQLDLSTEGIMNRQGAIFFLIMNQVFSSLGSLHLLLDEQEIVSHEARSAMYPISAYYMAKQFAELPVLLITTLIFAVVTYWMVGFQNHLSNFLTYIAAVVLTGVVGESYILVCGSVTTSSKVAIVIAPVLMALFMLFGGFFVNAGSVPAYYAWIKYISLFNYLNGAMQKNEFQGLTFEGGLTGDQVIDSLHLMSLSVWGNLGVICGMIIVFRILAFIFVNRNFTPPPFHLPPQDVVDLVDLKVEEEKSIGYQST